MEKERNRRRQLYKICITDESLKDNKCAQKSYIIMQSQLRGNTSKRGKNEETPT